MGAMVSLMGLMMIEKLLSHKEKIAIIIFSNPKLNSCSTPYSVLLTRPKIIRLIFIALFLHLLICNHDHPSNGWFEQGL